MKRWRAADTAFAFNTALVILLAHAVAYFTHEFSHSVAAWAFGYMSNPFALDYGAPTPGNVVLLSGVGDNVQYEPIIPAIAPGGGARTAMMVAITATWFFFLYGGAGLSGSYGAVSQMFSLVSALLLMPLAIVWLWHQCAGDPQRCEQGITSGR